MNSYDNDLWFWVALRDSHCHIWWVVFTGVLCSVLLQQAIITGVWSVTVTYGLRQSHRVFCVARMLENCVTPTWWLKHSHTLCFITLWWLWHNISVRVTLRDNICLCHNAKALTVSYSIKVAIFVGWSVIILFMHDNSKDVKIYVLCTLILTLSLTRVTIVCSCAKE